MYCEESKLILGKEKRKAKWNIKVIRYKMHMSQRVLGCFAMFMKIEEIQAINIQAN